MKPLCLEKRPEVISEMSPINLYTSHYISILNDPFYCIFDFLNLSRRPWCIIVSVFLILRAKKIRLKADSAQTSHHFPWLSNLLFTRKPWRGRPSEPWPTTALHPTPTPYKHIRRCIQPSTFIGGPGEILGAIVSSYQTIAFSTEHVWAHLMHGWTNRCDLGPFGCRKQHNKPLGTRY
jgi:hypothetical protein